MSARLHCLIIDDRSTSALSLKAALSVMGFSTFGFASSPAQASAAARMKRPDLVIAALPLDGLAEDIGEAPVICLGEEVEGPPGAIVLERPIARAALAEAWERLRESEGAVAA